jgi:hypothetical protein
MNSYCLDYVRKLQNGNIQENTKILNLIDDKMKFMEKGAVER